MNYSPENVSRMIEQMDKHLRTELLKKDGRIQEEKLWENTYIKRQIDKREGDGVFTVSDHIRAMVYSLLSGGQGWAKYARQQDVFHALIRFSMIITLQNFWSVHRNSYLRNYRNSI